MTIEFEEPGHAFELRAKNVARAIHDPSGLQGSIIHKGKERDAVFFSQSDVHAYEFTIGRDRAKAEKDAGKLQELLEDLSKMPDHAYKTLVGWFVTLEEPTPEQRAAVKARSGRNVLHAISIAVLQQRVCDSDKYLQLRTNAPFGSIAYLESGATDDLKIDVVLTKDDSSAFTVADLASNLISGHRALLSGDFGVGKSHTMRELYQKLRKEHFRRKKLTPFPVHINLRDCVGLRTPAEILRRHAEEIGFPDEKSLISAWRAGACILLLDGFDEIVPVRWLGSASDLRNVRWEALAPVRRLVEESPKDVGVVLSGRSQYFSSDREMREALGLSAASIALTLSNFNEQQVEDYLRRAGVTWSLPDWLPSRPLLLGYLVTAGGLDSLNNGNDTTQAAAWRSMFSAICTRESKMFTAVRPDTIRQIIARVATLARSQGNTTGPVSMDLMRQAFVDVNNRQPDAEGLQVLLRLPGLASPSVSTGEDDRIFVDQDLADTAYGEDLASHLVSPYSEHPLADQASWVSASSDLGVAVTANAVNEHGITGKAVLAVATQRQNANKLDAVLADVLRVAEELGGLETATKSSFTVEGVIFDQLTLGADHSIFARVNFVDCVIQVLDMAAVDSVADLSYFRGGIVGHVEGMTALPDWLGSRFTDVDIEQFAIGSHTTSGILQLKLPSDLRIALTILKKVYAQKGSGRKESSLFRGLDSSTKQEVPSVISRLIADGWVSRETFGTTVSYLPVKGKRSAALRALENPAQLSLGK